MKQTEEVIARFERANDLELHVKRTVLSPEGEDEVELVSLREYIPSRDWYGRGITFPAELAPRIVEALQVEALSGA